MLLFNKTTRDHEFYRLQNTYLEDIVRTFKIHWHVTVFAFQMSDRKVFNFVTSM